MWIDRKTYETQQLTNAAALTEARVLAEQNRALMVSLDWLRVRVTQLEIERSQLLFNYTGVKVPVPSIERERTPVEDVTRMLNTVQGFQDMGDTEAHRQGIGWNDDGSLKDTKD